MLYDRETLVTVLVHHQRLDSQRCLCGWDELGKSHAEHIASAYEATITSPDSSPEVRRD